MTKQATRTTQVSEPVTPIDPAPRPAEDSSSLASLHVGRVIGGRYVLSSRIAIGGMGEVWRAIDNRTDEALALKVLRPELAGQQLFLSRLRIEATNASALHHPNLAEVKDSGEEEGLGWIAMELVEGTPLTQILTDNPTLPIDFLLSVMMQTANALDTVHRAGIVHRDIKPGNLMVTPQGMVKLTDFGISRAANQVTLTAAGMVMGTAQYLPPEQAVGNPATPAGDLYALGVIAYESLAGKRPFTGKKQVDIAFAHVNKPVPPLPESVPAPLADLVMDLLAKDPRQRPASALELGDRIEAVMRELGITFARSPEEVEEAAEAAKQADAAARAQAAAIERAEAADLSGEQTDAARETDSADAPSSQPVEVVPAQAEPKPAPLQGVDEVDVASKDDAAAADEVDAGVPVEMAVESDAAARVDEEDLAQVAPQPTRPEDDAATVESEDDDEALGDLAELEEPATPDVPEELEDTGEEDTPDGFVEPVRRAQVVDVAPITPLPLPSVDSDFPLTLGDEDLLDRSVPLEADGSPISRLAGGTVPAPFPMPDSVFPARDEVDFRRSQRQARLESYLGADVSDTTSRPVEVLLDPIPEAFADMGRLEGLEAPELYDDAYVHEVLDLAGDFRDVYEATDTGEGPYPDEDDDGYAGAIGRIDDDSTLAEEARQDAAPAEETEDYRDPAVFEDLDYPYFADAESSADLVDEREETAYLPVDDGEFEPDYGDYLDGEFADAFLPATEDTVSRTWFSSPAGVERPMPTNWSPDPGPERFIDIFSDDDLASVDAARHVAEVPLLQKEAWLGPLITAIVLFLVTFMMLLVAGYPGATSASAEFWSQSAQVVKEPLWVTPLLNV